MTRKLRWLVAVPLGCALAFLVAHALAPGAEARNVVVRIGVETAKSMALLGSVLAAQVFKRGDHLRRAWRFLALSSAFLLLRDVLLIPVLYGLAPVAMPWIRAGLASLANVAGVLGTWLLANAWSIAGVELPGSRFSRRGLMALAAVLALAIAGPTTWLRVQEAGTGNARAVAMVISGLADSAQLMLLAPVILTAAALRGGLLAWIWGLYAASQLAWLFYDALDAYGELILPGAPGLLSVAESLRVLALLLTFSAGIAQRSVLLAARVAPPPAPLSS
jgi:hypothetical protein